MKIARWVLLSFLVLFVLQVSFWAITPEKSPVWTGFGAYDEDTQGPRSKTLWDWLDLLIIPVVLALGAWILSSAEKAAEQKKEIDRQRQDVLNLLLEKFTNLLLDKKLRSSKPRDEIRGIARSYVLSAFRLLDPYRKAEALQFLYETNLINNNPIINLNGADLRNIQLKRAAIIEAQALGAHFEDACLRNANITGSNFCGSNFTGADFRGAIFTNTDLSFTFLNGADLRNCDLTKANLTGAILLGAKLTRAKISSEQMKLIASYEKTILAKKEK